MGTYKLKGVAGYQTVMQINSVTFADRPFPKKAASSKAELVPFGTDNTTSASPHIFLTLLKAYFICTSLKRLSVQVSPGTGLAYTGSFQLV